MALGYAEPDGPLRAIDLSQPVYQWIYALKVSAGAGIVTPQMARSAYVLAQPPQVWPVASTRSAERLEELIGAASLELSAGEVAWLEAGGD